MRILGSTNCGSTQCCPNGLLVLGVCYEIEVPYCTTFEMGEPFYCIVCSQGRIPVDGVCEIPVKLDDVKCNKLVDGSDECHSCDEGYILDQDAICHRDFNIPPSRCVNFPEFSLLGDHCLYKDAFCDRINQTDSGYPCIGCREGFSLINGTC